MRFFYKFLGMRADGVLKGCISMSVFFHASQRVVGEKGQEVKTEPSKFSQSLYFKKAFSIELKI